MDRRLFKDFPLIAGNEPLVSDQFYQWLKDTETFKPANKRQSRHSNFFESMDLYLKGYGYEKAEHRLDPDDLKTLEYVFDMYQTMFTPIKDTDINNLLRPSDDKESSFWVRGLQGRYKPTALLRSVLNDIGVIYAIEPQHYYFELSGDYLFIKYQSILGSRRLCKVKSEVAA